MGAGLGDVNSGVVGRKAHGNLPGLHGWAAGAFGRAHGKVQINGGSAVFGSVGQMGDQPVSGILFGTLKHMGDAGSGNHSVLQQNIAYLNGRKQKLVAVGHSGTS